jgi:hypothetical protein
VNVGDHPVNKCVSTLAVKQCDEDSAVCASFTNVTKYSDEQCSVVVGTIESGNVYAQQW